MVLLSGSHRLATGTATRLLEDGDLQERILGKRLLFDRYGGFAFRITVSTGNETSEEQFEIIWRSDSGPRGRQANVRPTSR
jgi:hypothetical protein